MLLSGDGIAVEIGAEGANSRVPQPSARYLTTSRVHVNSLACWEDRLLQAALLFLRVHQRLHGLVCLAAGCEDCPVITFHRAASFPRTEHCRSEAGSRDLTRRKGKHFRDQLRAPRQHTLPIRTGCRAVDCMLIRGL